MITKERTRNTIHALPAVFCSCIMVTAGGCVMQSTYDSALQEGTITKTELARAKEEQRALTRQASDLEQLNADVMREAEAATSALRQAKEDADDERQQAQQQMAKLQQKAAQATKQQRALKYELTVAKENGAALQEIIDVYQKKVRDGALGPEPASTAEPAVHKPFDPSSIPVPQDLPAAPAVAPPTPVPAPAPAPAPAPHVTPSKHPQPPQDEGWFSSITGWLVSLWRSVFS